MTPIFFFYDNSNNKTEYQNLLLEQVKLKDKKLTKMSYTKEFVSVKKITYEIFLKKWNNTVSLLNFFIHGQIYT